MHTPIEVPHRLNVIIQHRALRLGWWLACCAALGLLWQPGSPSVAQSGCASPSFSALTNLNAGPSPQAVVAGDFNLDGRLDLAVANRNGQISLLFNNGSGGFTNNSFSAGAQLTGIVAGDFNGDQRLDLVVAGEVGPPLLALNNGSGGFATSTPIPATGNAVAIATGDFNTDGKLDLAVGATDGNIQIFYGNGTGGFGTPVNLTVGTGVFFLLASDFNTDGKPDLAALNSGGAAFSVLLSNTAGGFETAASYSLGIDNAAAMASGDFNSDGKPDLVVVNRNNNRVSVQLNSGIGTFNQSQNFGTTATPLAVAVGDFNGDNLLDLALGGAASELEIRLGNDTGQFDDGFKFTSGGQAAFNLAADVNSDGRLDLAAANPVEGNLTVLLNACPAPPANTPPTIVAAGALTRQQGVGGTVDIIATVSDAQTPPGNLKVFATSLPTGITLSNLTNTNGSISASIGAACNAAPIPLIVSLLVTDAAGLSATTTLTINVTVNTPPNLSAYPNTTVFTGAGATVLPAQPPSDNVAITNITAIASAGYNGLLNVNQVTGVVTITNAQPAGSYAITVTARDNCNATTTQSFALTVSPPQCINTRPGLISWYRGEASAADHQNTNNGAGVNGLAFAPGQVGQALSFNGSSEVVIPHSPSLNLQQFTFEGWVYPTLIDGSVELILNKEDEPFTTYHYELGIAGMAGNIPTGTFLFALHGINGLPSDFGGFVNGGGRLPLNTWTHFALSYNGNTIKSYLNGVVVRSLTGLSGNLITSTGPLKLGSRANTLINQEPANRFNGLLDEISIYGRSLSEQELTAIYNSGTAGKCTSFVNTTPLITAGAALTQQQGNSGALAMLGTVSDRETEAGELTVTVTNAPAGLTFSNLTNTNGTITANLNVACFAALGANPVTLRVSDGALSSTATFTVNVTANTPPMLGSYTTPGALLPGASVNVTPSAAPTDNGMLTSVFANVAGDFTGSVGVNPATGIVTISNVRPAGAFTVTVTATDNCGVAVTTSFNFTVSKLSTNVILTAAGAPFAQSQPADLIATVSPTTLTAILPGGTVSFFDGATQLGNAALDSAGVARLRTSALEPGPRGLTAVYSGDANFLAATSVPLGLTVAFAATHVSAASYRAVALAPEQIVAAFGVRLATTQGTATTLPLPTTLVGTAVRVLDSTGSERLAALFFVSPTQVNYLLPAGLAAGEAIITVIASDGVRSIARVQIAPTNPGIFTADASGRGLPAAQVLRVLANGTQVYEAVARFDTATGKYVAVPIDLGAANDQVFLVLFGTGWRGRNSALPVTASLGNTTAEVVFIGAAPGLLGVDQANLRLSRTLIGAGELEVNLSVDGKAANPVRINIR